MTVALAVPDVLVARAKAGDQAALEALFRAFETPVYNLARRIMRTPEDAEDVLQETFLEVVRSIGQYRGEGHLWGWIRRVAATKALMRIRRDHLRAAEPLDDEPAGRSGSHVGANIDLERAFEQLTDTSRAVVWMHDVEGYTHEEISELMGKSVSVSKSRVARLKALPALRPPRDRWSVVRDAARVQRVRRRRTWGSWGLAAAAALVGV